MQFRVQFSIQTEAQNGDKVDPLEENRRKDGAEIRFSISVTKLKNACFVSSPRYGPNSVASTWRETYRWTSVRLLPCDPLRNAGNLGFPGRTETGLSLIAAIYPLLRKLPQFDPVAQLCSSANANGRRNALDNIGEILPCLTISLSSSKRRDACAAS